MAAGPLENVSSTGVDQLLARAFEALTPGSRIVLHDFMIDDDGSGPATAAHWLVNALLIDPDVARLSFGLHPPATRVLPTGSRSGISPEFSGARFRN